MQCVVPENIHTPTTEGIGNSEGVGGGGLRGPGNNFQSGVGLDNKNHFSNSVPFEINNCYLLTDLVDHFGRHKYRVSLTSLHFTSLI